MQLRLPAEMPFEDVQAALVLPDARGLVPSTEIFWGEHPFWSTNSFGLRAPEPTPGRKLAIVWGDSIVFGAPDNRGGSWVSRLAADVASHQVLNGGIPGCPLSMTLDRMRQLNEVLPVDVNMVVASWHRSTPNGGPYNVGLRDYLGAALERCDRVVLVTTPTSLNEQIVDHDLRIYADDAKRFVWEHEPGIARAWLGSLMERNEIVREVGAAMGIPVFDWFETLRTTSLEDFRRDFVDFGHLRGSVAPKIVAIWAAWLRQNFGDQPTVDPHTGVVGWFDPQAAD
jgi:hypothetical protein